MQTVHEDEISLRTSSDVEYAAALLYAEYLGIRVIGRKPVWIQRLRKFPRAVPPTLLEEVQKILRKQNIFLTDDGQLVSLLDTPRLPVRKA